LTAFSRKGYTQNKKPKYIWLSYSKKLWKFSFTSWDNTKSCDEKLEPPATSTKHSHSFPLTKKLQIIIIINMLIQKYLSKTFATDNLYHEKNIHTKRNGKKQN
jgi:hypothetical protein